MYFGLSGICRPDSISLSIENCSVVVAAVTALDSEGDVPCPAVTAVVVDDRVEPLIVRERLC